MKKAIWQLFGLFNSKERSRLYVLFGLMFITGTLQMVSVVAVMPFIGVVTNPKLVETNPLLSYMYSAGGFENTTRFLIFLGVGVLVLILLSNICFGISVYLQQRFAQNFQVSLARRIMDLYLRQRYSFFLHQNSTHLSKKIVEDAAIVADTMLTSILDLLIGGLISLFLVALIVFVDPLLAFFIMIFIGVFYGIIFKLYYKNTVRLGEERTQASAARFKVLSEAFNSVKDTKLYGVENVFIDKFVQSAKIFSKANSRIRVQVKVPGLTLDLIIFGGIMMIVLYILIQQNDLNASLPIITLYGFTAYRLKPQIQVIFNSISNINFSQASLSVVLRDVAELSKTVEPVPEAADRLPAFSKLSLNNIVFGYPKSEELVLKGVSLEIAKKQSVAFVGPSGSGKTTLVDIVLGLLDPQKGDIVINDGIKLDENSKPSWQSKLGYVPQQIYLLDDNIMVNIAFGIPAHEIDLERINAVIEMADLKDFIASLPKGLHTMIGERGVRLSGGQRQRIGIARALYRQPEVLILDEATSALDGITEDNIIGSLNRIKGNITLIMIAHRLTTVQNCDVIFMVEGGIISQAGSFPELMETSTIFKRMAKAASF